MNVTHEIEVKLRFASPDAARERLRALGAKPVRERAFEDNEVFERPADPLEPHGKVLRLRRVGEDAWLTFKVPVKGESPHKVVEEYETAVADAAAMAALLGALGFVRAWRYQKYRTIFGLGDVEISLDETPLGCFVELEGRAEEIDRTAARMGFAARDYIRDSYRELQRKSGEERAGDLLVEPERGGQS